MKINPDNWFWCDLCDCVSYDYKCECRGTSCNCGGCEKCAEIRLLVEQAFEYKEAPSEEEAKKNNIKKFGSVDTPEQKILKEIFGE